MVRWTAGRATFQCQIGRMCTCVETSSQENEFDINYFVLRFVMINKGDTALIQGTTDVKSYHIYLENSQNFEIQQNTYPVTLNAV